jgi:hypothetical protein
MSPLFEIVTLPPDTTVADLTAQLAKAQAEIARLRKALEEAADALRFQHPDSADELYEQQDQAFARHMHSHSLPPGPGWSQSREDARLAAFRDFVDHWQTRFFDDAIQAINDALRKK